MKRRGRLIALLILMILVACVAGFWAVNPLGMLPNHGLPLGYHRNHNIVRKEVSKITGTRIARNHYHEDVTLENSSLFVEIDDQVIHLYFYWSALPDSTSPRALVRDLRQQIADHQAAGSPSQRSQLSGTSRVMAITVE